jgi:hypothetical protein
MRYASLSVDGRHRFRQFIMQPARFVGEERTIGSRAAIFKG